MSKRLIAAIICTASLTFSAATAAAPASPAASHPSAMHVLADGGPGNTHWG
ncbi:MAG: hypothetical protein ACRDNF_25540 [Streptosporangiaceae bacterium]